MSSTDRLPWENVLEVALEFIRLLRPCCTRIAIGGSLRRGAPMVGDVELVVMPYFETVGDMQINTLEILFEMMLINGIVEKRLRGGNKVMAWGDGIKDAIVVDGKYGNRRKAAMYKGFFIDTYIVLPDRQWGPTMVLRTGPGSANGSLVTDEGRKNWSLNVMGVLPFFHRFKDAAIYREDVRLDTPEEADVFAACHLPWIPAYLRSDKMYLLAASRRGEFPYGKGGYYAVPRGTQVLVDEIYYEKKPYWVVNGELVETQPETPFYTPNAEERQIDVQLPLG